MDSEYPGFNVLFLFGFPCQPTQVYNQRQGFFSAIRPGWILSATTSKIFINIELIFNFD